MAFRFRLQKVLELREEKERDAATRLAHSRQEAEAARAARSTLESTLNQGVSRLTEAGAGARSVGELRSRMYVIRQLEERVQRAAARQAQAEQEVEARTSEYTGAFRDRRILDRLRDRHREEWQIEETKADLMNMDGIALGRFTSGGSPVGEEDL